MSASLKIGRVFGIPIYLHITFLLILPVFVWVFSEQKGEILSLPIGFGDLETEAWVRYSFGTIAAVVFFGTVVAHELAHSYLALRFGVRIKSITLMLFGGIASMEEIPKQPGMEWKMAFAGPLTSYGMAALSLMVMLVLGLFESDAVLMEGTITLLGLIGMYNILLGSFNLIPAFPMDGGRLLRSYYASRMPFIDATKRAARVGRYFAIGMGIFGLVFNFWLILIAFLVYIGASEEEQSTVITESLSGVRVRQLMTGSVEVVHPDTSAQQLLDLMLSTRHMGFPVVEFGLVGIVTLSDVQKVPRDRLYFTRTRDIMTKDVVTIGPEEEASSALRKMSERKIGRLVVVEGNRIVGIVTRKDFLQAVEVLSSRQQWGYRPPGQGQQPGLPQNYSQPPT